MRHFFVIGVGRSGTTLLRLMLNAHPSIAIPYETDFLDKYFSSASVSGRFLGVGDQEIMLDQLLTEPMLQKWDHKFRRTDLLDRIRRSGNVSMSSLVSAIYESYAEAKGKQYWGDKSSYCDSVPNIYHGFPSAKFIHIIRDGRDVARSVLKLPWGPQDIIAAAEWWSEHVRLFRRMGEIMGSDKYMEVQYECLVQNPQKELEIICNFLNENYCDSMLNYHQSTAGLIPEDRKSQHYNVDKPPQVSRVFAWKKKMSPTDITLFGKYAGRMLDELRYSRLEETAGSKRVLFRTFNVLAKRVIKSRPKSSGISE